MKTSERKEITETNEKKFGTEFKKTKWHIITVETKDSPDKPKSFITGEVAWIYPTGDIAFNKVTDVSLWYPETNKFVKLDIPSYYKAAKKITIRREIIATVLYIEEEKEIAEPPVLAKTPKPAD